MTFIGRILFCLGISIAAYGCLDFGGCSFQLQQNISNPSNTLKLIKYRRECGATVNSSMGILLSRSSDTLIDEKNTFFISYWDSVQVKWLSDSNVLIKYPKGLEVFKKDSVFGGLKIRYEPLTIKHVLDTSKRIKINSDTIKSIELVMGDWRWKEQHWAFQKNTMVVINERKLINQFCTVLQSAPLNAGPKSIHTNWLSIVIKTNTGSSSMILQRSEPNQYHVNNINDGRSNDWFDGLSLAAFVSAYLQKHPPKN